MAVDAPRLIQPGKLVRSAKVFNLDTIAEGKVVLDEFGRLNKLFAKIVYTPGDKTKILAGLKDLGVLKDDNAGEFCGFDRIAANC